MPIKVYPGGAKSNVKNVYVYPGGQRRRVVAAYAYPGGQKRRIFSANSVLTFNGPNTSGTGDNGTGPLYSIAPYPVAPRGSLSLDRPLSTTVIGLHIDDTVAPQGLWLTVNTQGPHSDLVGKRVYINGVQAMLNGTPANALTYMSSPGFGGWFYVSGTWNNIVLAQNTNYNIEFR